jgi:3-phenylpropionate/cinnamic acid dioxygenase small subunit
MELASRAPVLPGTPLYGNVVEFLHREAQLLDSYRFAEWLELFTEDATYAYHPYDEPLHGREAIVASWLADRDEPGSWEARYAPLMLDGDRAIATGETRYANGRRFSNLFVLRYDEAGRCREFVEWVIEQPNG